MWRGRAKGNVLKVEALEMLQQHCKDVRGLLGFGALALRGR